jgi:DNA-binding MarR family transcriptional regulator
MAEELETAPIVNVLGSLITSMLCNWVVVQLGCCPALLGRGRAPPNGRTGSRTFIGGLSNKVLAPKNLTLKEIAEKSRLPEKSLSTLMSRLLQDGHVEVTHGAGEQILGQIPPELHQMVEELIEVERTWRKRFPKRFADHKRREGEKAL